MAGHNPALRAQTFMRKCRCAHQTRAVSSSHLAPSNFSKPLRSQPSTTTTTTSPSSTSDGLPASTPQWMHPVAMNRPPITEITSRRVPPGFFAFIKYRVFNFVPPRVPMTQPPFNVLNNPYRARKSWPPDFRNLHPKQQFHFEKTFRRRMILKSYSQRATFLKVTKLIQQSLVVLMVIYFAFIADPWKKEGVGTPMDGFRAWFFGQIAKYEHLPLGMSEQAQHLQSYYQHNADNNPYSGKNRFDPRPEDRKEEAGEERLLEENTPNAV